MNRNVKELKDLFEKTRLCPKKDFYCEIHFPGEDDKVRMPVTAKYYETGYVYLVFEESKGDCGDEYGFGRDNGSYLVAIIDKGGNYVLPFTHWEEREAQWKALECGIEPICLRHGLRQEFDEQHSKSK